MEKMDSYDKMECRSHVRQMHLSIMVDMSSRGKIDNASAMDEMHV